MTSQAVMKRYLTSVAKNNEEYKENKTIQYIASLIANYKKLEAKDKEELDAKIEIAYGKLQAKGVSASKSTSKATTTRRTKSSSDGGLKGILADLKKKLGAEKFKDATTGTDIKKDIQIPALKKGKRIVRKKGYTSNFYGTFKNKVGSTYYENRANRYDANQPSQTRKYKLADGGEVGNKVYNEMYGVGSSKYLVNFHDGEKTHKDGSPFFDIRIFKNKVEKDKFVKELKSKGFVYKYAEGGEIEVGSIVNLPEIKMKDGRVQYERVVGGEVIGIEDGIYDVLNPKTNRLHRVTKQQIEQIDQAKAKHTRSRASLRSNEDTYPKGTEFAKGGKTSEEYAVSGILSENDEIEIISKHKSFASALVKMNKMWDEGKLDKYLEVRVRPISKSMEYAKGGEVGKETTLRFYGDNLKYISHKNKTFKPIYFYEKLTDSKKYMEQEKNGIRKNSELVILPYENTKGKCYVIYEAVDSHSKGGDVKSKRENYNHLVMMLKKNESALERSQGTEIVEKTQQEIQRIKDILRNEYGEKFAQGGTAKRITRKGC